MKRHHRTENKMLRAWGNSCGWVADLFLSQAVKYGDYYKWEDIDTSPWPDENNDEFDLKLRDNKS